MVELRCLKDVPMDHLYLAFSEAFVDYEMQLDQHELSKMLLRRGFDPELSFGAFDGDRAWPGRYLPIPFNFEQGRDRKVFAGGLAAQ